MIAYRNLRVLGCGNSILNGVDLVLPERGVAILLGPSGCGKTMLLRCTIREDEDDPDIEVQGEIELAGRSVRGRDYPSTTLRREVGLIAQQPTPFPGTALENVAFALRLTTKLSRAAIGARCLAALAEAGLEPEHHNTQADCLSGGQVKRLAIARAIALEPKVLLMDEPSNGLDPLSAAHVERLITSLGTSRLVVVVTHDVGLARRTGDVVHVLWPFAGGSRVVESGAPREVLDAPRARETRLFVAAADHGAAAMVPFDKFLRDLPANERECCPRTLELDPTS